jgi:hypothetical protein
MDQDVLVRAHAPDHDASEQRWRARDALPEVREGRSVMRIKIGIFGVVLIMFVGSVITTLVRAAESVGVVTIQRTIEVPPGATLNYLINGQVVQSMPLPVGTASITLRFEPRTDSVGNPIDTRGKIVDKHGRIIRRTP